MSEARLGGDARSTINPIKAIVSALHITTIPTMTDAIRRSRRQFWAGYSPKDSRVQESIGNKPVDGDKARLAQAMEVSEQLVAEAIAYDTRLARRAQWRRRDEGEHVCTALLSEGDDQPFYKHTRAVVNDATASGEPVRVVISTDDDEVPPNTAAAFIATARLVQQFVPLEIWWQGAWLNEHRTRGFVSLVPLVQGDMDFSRLEFCIADPMRDAFSFQVMASQAVLEIRESWNECGYRAQEHYLMGNAVKHPDGRQRANAHFLSHKGIAASVSPQGTWDARSVADHAAAWLGWVERWEVRYEEMCNAESAAQELPPERVPTRDDYRVTAADRQRWEAEERAAKKEANRRLEKKV